MLTLTNNQTDYHPCKLSGCTQASSCTGFHGSVYGRHVRQLCDSDVSNLNIRKRCFTNRHCLSGAALLLYSNV